MSDCVRPHRWQLTRLPRPWDSPGKNTGVGCHFLLQCMKVKSESEGTQSCPTLNNPMDCSLPGSSVHGIFQFNLLKYHKLCAQSLQLCPTLCDPTDSSSRGSSVHGIFQARILKWIAMPSSRGSSQPRKLTQVIKVFAGGYFTTWRWGRSSWAGPLTPRVG